MTNNTTIEFELAFPHIKNILDEVCEDGKVEMMALPSSQLGSWKRAVTTSDGCWQVFLARTTHQELSHRCPAVVWPCVDARDDKIEVPRDSKIC